MTSKQPTSPNPVPPCRPGCTRCAKALRLLGPESYNNWRSWQMYADPPEVHEQPVVADTSLINEDERTP